MTNLTKITAVLVTVGVLVALGVAICGAAESAMESSKARASQVEAILNQR